MSSRLRVNWRCIGTVVMLRVRLTCSCQLSHATAQCECVWVMVVRGGLHTVPGPGGANVVLDRSGSARHTYGCPRGRTIRSAARDSKGASRRVPAALKGAERVRGCHWYTVVPECCGSVRCLGEAGAVRTGLSCTTARAHHAICTVGAT